MFYGGVLMFYSVVFGSDVLQFDSDVLQCGLHFQCGSDVL